LAQIRSAAAGRCGRSAVGGIVAMAVGEQSILSRISGAIRAPIRRLAVWTLLLRF
jgi:hypothetical protein